MAGARLEGIAKSFGDTQVLKGIDLQIAPESFTVLLGPSGCGKSTTLRILAGLERQSAGRVFIGERDVSYAEPRERNVAMVFQNYALYPNMTVAQNIGFGLKAKKRPAAEIARSVAEVGDMLGLSSLLQRRPRHLSGGQQQRVAIGRAIVRDPSLFLFDEPLSNLDAKLRVEMRAELLRLHRALGATTVYVTHDQEEAMSMADTIVVMHEGGLDQVGPPAEIYLAPATLKVAEFVGSPAMNLFDGRGTGPTIDTALGSVQVQMPVEGPVRLGVRPDDLVRTPCDTDLALGFEATVELIEFLGARSIVTANAQELRMKAVFDSSEVIDLSTGARVALGIPSDRLHMFASEGGHRL